MIVKDLIKKLLRDYYQHIFLNTAVTKLRNNLVFSSTNELVEYVFSFRVGLNYRYLNLNIKSSQIKSEIVKLCKLLVKNKVKNILEIGTADGGTLFLFSNLVKNNGKIISIDLPNGYPLWRAKLYKSFVSGNKKLYLIRNNSHEAKTVKMVEKILNGEKLDFLFIDGDHSYYGVRKDFEMYSKLVKSRGIIAFHDIIPDKIKNLSGEVWKFWKEIKSKYKHTEIVESYQQNGYGIGVIYVK
jgi:predicted O-methyltransferase YrrM